MKFRFVWVGKTRDKDWRTLQDEYLRRLSHFVNCEIAEVKDARTADQVNLEGNRIVTLLNQKSFVCLLDERGLTLTSRELAALVEGWQDRGIKEAVFVIGGSKGVSSRVAERADISLSLSFLTFTHEMARVVLLEQLYRAYTIIKGFPYQK